MCTGYTTGKHTGGGGGEEERDEEGDEEGEGGRCIHGCCNARGGGFETPTAAESAFGVSPGFATSPRFSSCRGQEQR